MVRYIHHMCSSAIVAEQRHTADHNPFKRTYKKPGPVYVDTNKYEIKQIINIKGSGRAKQYLVR
jgi:hypothetical protein